MLTGDESGGWDPRTIAGEADGSSRIPSPIKYNPVGLKNFILENSPFRGEL